MGRVVVDSNVTIAYVTNEDGLGPSLSPLFRHSQLVAPWLWKLEVVNTILVLERRKVLPPEHAIDRLERLQSLTIELLSDPPGRTLADLAAVARPHQLSAYDAVYLDLAVRESLPLATMDRNLQRAAGKVGVELAWPSGS